MADSLNNFIDKAGKGVSEKLSELVLGKKFKPDAKNHSGKYFGPLKQLNNRTNLVNLTKKPDSFQSSPASRLKEANLAGITPIEYYRVDDKGEVISPTSSIPFATGYEIKLITGTAGIPSLTTDRLKENKEAYKGFKDEPTSDFRFGLQAQILSSSTASISGSTPEENEDPVYFGFEIEIDVLNSPLINGEALEFLNTFGVEYDEIRSRVEILKSFIHELSRYFSFNIPKDSGNIYVTNLNNLFGTKLNKKFYVKKVSGLDKLIEANSSSALSSFTKYKTDVLTISFEEDTNLNTGTLASLYKLLYWSRIKGKNIIPENLLRFDCKIVVSEARNLLRIRKSGLDLEVLRENVSRYVYNIYECQLFFKSMTHPSDIDMSQPFSYTPAQYSIELNYKFSDMTFERFAFNENQYKSLKNVQDNPLEIKSKDANSAIINEFGIQPFNTFKFSTIDESGETSGGGILGDLKKNDSKSKFAKAIADSSKVLVENIKKAALNETQRRLDDQFRLLNNTLDRVRNSFGIGRMSPPTNVYTGLQRNSFFFDVQNSLRNFAGDVLTQTIFGNGS
jgi:hypothetical protein